MAGEEVTPAAGITDQAETDVLLECGIKHLGFPFRLAKNKEDLAVEDTAMIIRCLPDGVTALLIRSAYVLTHGTPS